MRSRAARKKTQDMARRATRAAAAALVAALVVAPDAAQAFTNAPSITLPMSAPVSSLRMSSGHGCTSTHAGPPRKAASPKAQGAARITALVSALFVGSAGLPQPSSAKMTARLSDPVAMVSGADVQAVSADHVVGTAVVAATAGGVGATLLRKFDASAKRKAEKRKVRGELAPLHAVAFLP